jgi:hypothetical protein
MNYSVYAKYHAMMRAYAKLETVSTDNGPHIGHTPMPRISLRPYLTSATISKIG